MTTQTQTTRRATVSQYAKITYIHDPGCGEYSWAVFFNGYLELDLSSRTKQGAKAKVAAYIKRFGRPLLEAYTYQAQCDSADAAWAALAGRSR